MTKGRCAAHTLVPVGLNYAPAPTGIAPYDPGQIRGLHERGHEGACVDGLPARRQWRANRDAVRLAAAEVPAAGLGCVTTF